MIDALARTGIGDHVLLQFGVPIRRVQARAPDIVATVVAQVDFARMAYLVQVHRFCARELRQTSDSRQMRAFLAQRGDA